MRSFLFAAFLLGGGSAMSQGADFAPPVRLKAGDKAIGVENPGYACPSWADLEGNGKFALLVGQFAQGKIRVYKHLGAQKFAPGEWLQAAGKTAEIPGVW